MDAPSRDRPDDDAELVRRSLDRDDRAFAELVRRYLRRALAVAWEYCGTREDAEDIVQDAFTRVARALDRFDTRRPFAPWLFTIVRNTARDAGSARRRHDAALAMHAAAVRSRDIAGPGGSRAVRAAGAGGAGTLGCGAASDTRGVGSGRVDDALAVAPTDTGDRCAVDSDPAASIDAAGLGAAGWSRARSDDAPNPAELAEIRDWIGRAIDALPEMQRACFRLCEVEGFTRAEVAAMLGISEATVRVHLHRARGTLRIALRPLKEDAKS